MSYRDDFFKKENIIGYTGDLKDNPTVYFKKGSEFGRITQDHGNADNIGRNKVRTADDYEIKNSGRNGNAQEFYNGAVKHNSRNPFVEVTDESIDELAKSISSFKELKPKYSS